MGDTVDPADDHGSAGKPQARDTVSHLLERGHSSVYDTLKQSTACDETREWQFEIHSSID